MPVQYMIVNEKAGNIAVFKDKKKAIKYAEDKNLPQVVRVEARFRNGIPTYIHSEVVWLSLIVTANEDK